VRSFPGWIDSLGKRLASGLPGSWQKEMRQALLRRRIRRGAFSPGEPEFDRLDRWVREGDWVIDVGANVGHYTLRLAELVGPSGRVLAFEPVPLTFQLVTESVATAGHENVTLLNAAATAATRELGMAIPLLPTGLPNLYMASVRESGASFRVLGVAIDALGIPHRVSLAKIDAEGHDLEVLQGMERLLRRDRPLLIIEDSSTEIDGFLMAVGYEQRRLPGSPNSVFVAMEETARSEARP
jgi:FkbM family methyltransferase